MTKLEKMREELAEKLEYKDYDDGFNFAHIEGTAFKAGFDASTAYHSEIIQELVKALDASKDFIQDALSRANMAIATDCDQCDYQCQGCIRNIDDAEYAKRIIVKALENYKKSVE